MLEESATFSGDRVIVADNRGDARCGSVLRIGRVVVATCRRQTLARTGRSKRIHGIRLNTSLSSWVSRKGMRLGWWRRWRR
jgi:hypothetical protein